MAEAYMTTAFHLPVKMTTDLENLVKGRQFWLKQDGISMSAIVRVLLEKYLKKCAPELKEYEKLWKRLEKKIEKG